MLPRRVDKHKNDLQACPFQPRLHSIPHRFQMRRIIPIFGHLKDELVVVARLAQPFQRVIGDVTIGRAHQKGGQLAQIVRHPRNFHLFARAIGRFNAQHIPHVYPFQPKRFVQRRTLNQNGLFGRWPRPAHGFHFV